MKSVWGSASSLSTFAYYAPATVLTYLACARRNCCVVNG